MFGEFVDVAACYINGLTVVHHEGEVALQVGFCVAAPYAVGSPHDNGIDFDAGGLRHAHCTCF